MGLVAYSREMVEHNKVHNFLTKIRIHSFILCVSRTYPIYYLNVSKCILPGFIHG